MEKQAIMHVTIETDGEDVSRCNEDCSFWILGYYERGERGYCALFESKLAFDKIGDLRTAQCMEAFR